MTNTDAPAPSEPRTDWTLEDVAQEAQEIKLQIDETFVEGVGQI